MTFETVDLTSDCNFFADVEIAARFVTVGLFENDENGGRVATVEMMMARVSGWQAKNYALAAIKRHAYSYGLTLPRHSAAR